jgi:hypothetical protein
MGGPTTIDRLQLRVVESPERGPCTTVPSIARGAQPPASCLEGAIPCSRGVAGCVYPGSENLEATFSQTATVRVGLCTMTYSDARGLDCRLRRIPRMSHAPGIRLRTRTISLGIRPIMASLPSHRARSGHDPSKVLAPVPLPSSKVHSCRCGF